MMTLLLGGYTLMHTSMCFLRLSLDFLVTYIFLTIIVNGIGGMNFYSSDLELISLQGS